VFPFKDNTCAGFHWVNTGFHWVNTLFADAFLRLLQHSGLAALGRRAERKIAKFGGDVPGRRRLDASVSLALG